ncbi:penicillin-binding transpeptidase domain-containing protein [Anaerobium acetethylicum]|uniref:Penicillin-binding protein 2 n=1 Tax=Anaerobium acetethylicum TaxID=1619234 RepID=A0A1D3TNX6_9FIRM|nr:penicillin-binding transpeptidase domain-containing protein [Anaerobium acetethylicum]SCP95037.1 penicillin-binding protein 2 [Anaerobium acetethylicum]
MKKEVQVNLFSDIKEIIMNILKSRLFVLLVVFAVMFSVLVQRLFSLQIIQGEEYLENFTLKIIKERTIASTRGNIYDRNGELLAYSELAYSVKIEDNGSYRTTKEKNQAINGTIYELIKIIESNGDSLTSDLKILIDESGNYVYSVEGSKLLRFIADVYGEKLVDDLSEEQKNVSAENLIAYLRSDKRYDLSDEYAAVDALKILNIRYSMSANSFKKYVATTVAADVSDSTVAVVMENLDKLQGVSIAEDSVRKYVDSLYFSSIIGYTGKVDTEEDLKELQKKDEDYVLTDVVGQIGIEKELETELQGAKGYEKVYVDNVGRVIETLESKEPEAGNDVYLTIDKNLQASVYKILEQKLAGILVSKIRNMKTYTPSENSSSSDIVIPIDDVYFALINNSIIDINAFSTDKASSTEKAVYQKFLSKQSSVLTQLNWELSSNKPAAYESLDEEMQVYMSYAVSLLSNSGVLLTSKIDTSDDTYKAWKNETISLKEYLTHAISMNWIDTSKIDIESQYSDTNEIYGKLITYITDSLSKDSAFGKKLYKYMIKGNSLSGREICLMLFDQGVLEYNESEISGLNSGATGAYNFMLDKISNLKITPAQLALDPCSGSCVVTDTDTGEVLAMVSYPSYDNNRITESKYYAQLVFDLSKPMLNRATQQNTAPGSTFKMVSAIAGVQEGVISLNETVQCKGLYDKIEPVAKCWIYPSAHGNLNISGAIQHSCNYYFYEVGNRLSLSPNGTFDEKQGLESLKKYAEMFGLGEKSGVELPETEPQISSNDPVRSAIGQGTNNFTTVQLSKYVTAVANSGTVFNLSLLDKVTDSKGTLIKDYTPEVSKTVELPGAVWDAVHFGMRGVVEESAAFEGVQINVAGKTGTAQESKKRANHALFVGYAPYESPEISMSVRIANGYTSANAAAVASDVVKYYFNLADEGEVISGTASQPGADHAGD